MTKAETLRERFKVHAVDCGEQAMLEIHLLKREVWAGRLSINDALLRMYMLGCKHAREAGDMATEIAMLESEARDE